MNNQAPLSVSVQDGELVIRIGVDALAMAFAYSDWANQYDEGDDAYIRNVAITDTIRFAKDVALAMQHEEENGSSPLTDLLDSATQAAVEDGSIACEYGKKIRYGERAANETWQRKDNP